MDEAAPRRFSSGPTVRDGGWLVVLALLLIMMALPGWAGQTVPLPNLTNALTVISNPPPPLAPVEPEPLAWDAMTKEYNANTNESAAKIFFNVTNISTTEVVINMLRPSCGCTVAKMPDQPWRLKPGDTGRIEITADLRGKYGTLNKFIAVDSTAGFKMLRLRIKIPDNAITSQGLDQRSRNQMMALADRQAVFKGECVQCHVTPAIGQKNEVLYYTACGICHQPVQRATMVPDLLTKRHPNTREYWERWIAKGRIGTLMPGFSQSEGGPLTPEQITSLVEYCAQRFVSGADGAASQTGAAPKPSAPPALPLAQ